jgi:hypothetical protein
MSLSRILNDQPPPRTTQQELSPLARAAAEATLAPVSPIALVVASASPTDVSLDQNGQSAHDMDDQSVSTSTQGRTPALDAIREQVGIDNSASATPEPAPAPALTTTRGKNGTAPTENGSTTSRRKRKAAAQSTTAATTEPPGERRVSDLSLVPLFSRMYLNIMVLVRSSSSSSEGQAVCRNISHS